MTAKTPRPSHWIEPSLADAPAIKPEMHNGRLTYLVHGIARVDSLNDALELVIDRRSKPRSVQPMPTIAIRYDRINGRDQMIAEFI
jgi:hypothetical protein